MSSLPVAALGRVGAATAVRRRGPSRCSCGVVYDDFRTGQTFASVRRLMRDDPHPVHGGWRSKRRRGVLGYWHQLKQRMFELAHGYCEEMLSTTSSSRGGADDDDDS